MSTLAWFSPSIRIRVLVREIFETVILALLIFLSLHASIQNYRVHGPSMQPTLIENEYLIVNKLVYLRFNLAEAASILPFYDREEEPDRFVFHPPRRGSVIVFRSPSDPSRDFVKRVIGVPGDVVEIVEGDVYLNGSLLIEPYVTRKDNTSMGPVTVGPDALFVLGDNRSASNDSRAWGILPTENIIGRVWLRFWPIDRLGTLAAGIRPLSP